MGSARRRQGRAVTAGAQAMFVVEYPCDRFCRIEVDLSGERGQLTLQHMREKADGLHRRVHEPDLAERKASGVAEEEAGRSAARCFCQHPDGPLAADGERRRLRPPGAGKDHGQDAWREQTRRQPRCLRCGRVVGDIRRPARTRTVTDADVEPKLNAA